MIARAACRAVRAPMPARGPAFLHHDATATTGLPGRGRRHRSDAPTGTPCLEGAGGQETTPPRVGTRLCQGRGLDQVGRLHRFMRADVILAHQGQCRLGRDVLPCPAHLLLRACQQPARLAAAVAPLGAARDAPRRSFQAPRRPAQQARGGDRAASGQGGERRHAAGDAGLLSSRRREGRKRPLRAGDAGLPAISSHPPAARACPSWAGPPAGAASGWRACRSWPGPQSPGRAWRRCQTAGRGSCSNESHRGSAETLASAPP